MSGRSDQLSTGVNRRHFVPGGAAIAGTALIVRYLRVRAGGIDECFSLYGNHDVTVSNCLIHEGLAMSAHLKGLHGYGGLWGGQNITYYGNLLVHWTRSPRTSSSPTGLAADPSLTPQLVGEIHNVPGGGIDLLDEPGHDLAAAPGDALGRGRLRARAVRRRGAAAALRLGRRPAARRGPRRHRPADQHPGRGGRLPGSRRRRPRLSIDEVTAPPY